MTSRSYFGKMNSILGSVVPLAMFYVFLSYLRELSTIHMATYASKQSAVSMVEFGSDQWSPGTFVFLPLFTSQQLKTRTLK